jgi:hypothetical protein
MRVLICGLGSIGKRHLVNVLEIAPDAEVAVLRTRGTHDSLPGISAIFSELEQARKFNPQAVIIASPASLHAKQAIFFTESVESMLIEKPIAATSVQARMLQQSLNGKQCRVIAGYNLRYWSPLQELREMILEKKHGALMRFEAHVGQHLATWRVGVNPKESVSCHRALGGGVLRELSHEIDYSLWICGAPEKVRARSSRYLKYGDAEDSADIWMDLPGGVHAAIHMDMNDRMPRRNIRAICENGTIELDFLNSSLLVNGAVAIREKAPPIADTYKLEIKDLLQGSIKNVGATCKEAIAVLDVIEEAEKDAQ